MSTLDTTRYNQAMDRIEANIAIHDQFLLGDENVSIPVEGGTLISWAAIQKRLLSAQLDANDFVVQISDKMDDVVETEEQSQE